MIETSLGRHWFMHTPHAAVGLGIAARADFRLPPRLETAELPPATPQQTRTLRVGIVAGPEATWDLAAARLAERLRKDPDLEIHHAWDGVDSGHEDPTDYDCIVLLGWPAADHEYMVPGRQRTRRIGLYCRGGGSLVAVRAMHAEIAGWPDFAEEVLGGRQPPGRRFRLLEAQRSESAWHHPVVAGVETLIAEGEVYGGPRFSPDTTVLLTAQSAERAEPVAWTRRYGGGRVFCTTLGLDDDFREPGFLRLLANAVQWTGLVHG